MPGTIVIILVSALFGSAVVIKEKKVADEKAEIAKKQASEVSFEMEEE